MDIDTLMKLGVQSVGGALDYRNKNIGHVYKGDVILTPHGEEVVAELEAKAGIEDAVIVTKPKAKVIKAAAKPETPANPEDDPLKDLLG